VLIRRQEYPGIRPFFEIDDQSITAKEQAKDFPSIIVAVLRGRRRKSDNPAHNCPDWLKPVTKAPFGFKKSQQATSVKHQGYTKG